ncbi:MAG: DNA gyrase subunit A [Lentisphaeria bacterium]|nr:DNA gyrase subunit A [Lentisphaeria bacterium]
MDIIDEDDSNAGSFEPVNIEDIMHTAYLQYSLSVNVGRAIPDVRDGLKPVNRRILYAMRQQGLRHTHAFAKCAMVVGEVMGRYHPHGDSAIYDTLVRMAQDFSMRHPLIWGQGNFGSIDGDPPAAYRYTECKMQRLAEELLQDLEKETVDFIPNYDDSVREPSVLPAGYPNLLVNGSTGIGVGMATSIPPHNLGEVIDATIEVIDNPACTVIDLMQHIKGPDLPTGATIMGLTNIKRLYETGRGGYTVRGKATIEETKTGGERIVVTEIPYALNKENLVKRIAELVNDKVIPGISNIQDLSSSRVGIKIVIDVKKNAMANVVLNQLYKHSQLQTGYGGQFLVVDKNRPKTLNLKQMLQAFIDHRFEVITRRSKYELAKAEQRAHILEGLLVAVDNIDEIVAMIRASRTREEATEKLGTRWDLTKAQCAAILDMRLHQLTGLAREELQKEFDELMIQIEYLRDLLAHRDKLMTVVKDELMIIRDKYANERRTEIIAGENEISIEDLIKKEICAITVSNTGYVKRLSVDNFRAQHRGGKGVVGMQTKEGDYVQHLFTAMTHDYVLIFTDKGKMHWLKAYEIPEAQRTSRGKAIVNLLEIETDEEIRAILTVSEVDVDDQYLVFATKKGYIKKTRLSEFKKLRRKGIKAIIIGDDDQLIDVKLADDENQFMVFSTNGMACRFKGTDVRAMGRNTRGVTAMRLKTESDSVVAMAIVVPSTDLLKITELGMGKRSNIGTGDAQIDKGSGYRLTRRGGKGVTSIKLKENDAVVASLRIQSGDEIMIITEKGQIVRMKTDEIRTIGRTSQGVKVMNLKKDDKIISITLIDEMVDEIKMKCLDKEGLEHFEVDGLYILNGEIDEESETIKVQNANGDVVDVPKSQFEIIIPVEDVEESTPEATEATSDASTEDATEDDADEDDAEADDAEADDAGEDDAGEDDADADDADADDAEEDDANDDD